MPPLVLSNAIVLITGAGSGINLAFAKLAARAGSRVLIADIKLTADGEKFVADSDSKKVVFTKCDVTKRKDLENLVDVSVRTWDDVPDVWVAGAGVFEPTWSNFWDDTEEDDYATVAINTIHPIKLTRIAIRSLLAKKKTGVVLLLASVAGYMGSFSVPVYCASKHAIVGFTRSLADLERLEGIKVCLIAPGIVQTPLWTDRPDKMLQFSYDPDTAVTGEAVADAMIDLVTDGKYGGGACLEITKAGTRELGTWDIPAPKSFGRALSKEAIDTNYGPVLEILKKDKEGASK